MKTNFGLTASEAIELAIKKLKKDQSPIAYQYDLENAEEIIPENEKATRQWIYQPGQKNMDLLVNCNDATGFEAEIVIFIHKLGENISPNFILRAISQLIVLEVDL